MHSTRGLQQAGPGAYSECWLRVGPSPLLGGGADRRCFTRPGAPGRGESGAAGLWALGVSITGREPALTVSAWPGDHSRRSVKRRACPLCVQSLGGPARRSAHTASAHLPPALGGRAPRRVSQVPGSARLLEGHLSLATGAGGSHQRYQAPAEHAPLQPAVLGPATGDLRVTPPALQGVRGGRVQRPRGPRHAFLQLQPGTPALPSAATLGSPETGTPGQWPALGHRGSDWARARTCAPRSSCACLLPGGPGQREKAGPGRPVRKPQTPPLGHSLLKPRRPRPRRKSRGREPLDSGPGF